MADTKISADKIKDYCRDRLKEIRAINDSPIGRNPSGFVCIAAFMGFLSRLAYGKNKRRDPKVTDQTCFMDFITNFMPSKYKPQAKLLYSTFRCGVVHAMSFDPEIEIDRGAYLSDPKNLGRGDADLFISHSSDKTLRKCCNGPVLQKIPNSNSYVLVASVLCDDIESAIDKMFLDQKVRANSEEFVQVQRLINGREVDVNVGLIPASNNAVSTVMLSGNGGVQ